MQVSELSVAKHQLETALADALEHQEAVEREREGLAERLRMAEEELGARGVLLEEREALLHDMNEEKQVGVL